MSVTDDRRLVPAGAAVLEPFVTAGVFNDAEVHLAATFRRLVPEVADEVVIGLATAARSVRLGHVCTVLTDVAGSVVPEEGPSGPAAAHDLPWPDPDSWSAALSASEIVATPAEAFTTPLRPLVWDGERLYLQRYFRHETVVAGQLLSRARPIAVDGGNLTAALDQLFGAESHVEPDRQRQAAAAALGAHLSVVAGGPGTGKTTTVARLLAVAVTMAEGDGTDPPRIALAAPTGKAAARMNEAIAAALDQMRDAGVAEATIAHVAGTQAVTIHRLLGAVPGLGFRVNQDDPLEHDIVVVDEVSMVSVSLMASLLAAVRPDARLVLVGDPDQLVSVEAGTVLADIVGAASAEGSPLAPHLTRLTLVHRFAADSAIASLAESVRTGDADGAIGRLTAPPTLLDGDDRVDWVRAEDDAGVSGVLGRLASAGVRAVEAARSGDADAAVAAAGEVKLLAATRRGPFGLYDWTDRIERAVAAGVDDLKRGERWFVGRPVLVTQNDRIIGVSNGDVGVVVATDPGETDERTVALRLAGDVVRIPPARLDSVETWWAMTIHRSQGSEFPDVVVSLPTRSGSPVLTRELLYTAVTRSRQHLTIVATEQAIREAIARPVARASGLAGRLNGHT